MYKTPPSRRWPRSGTRSLLAGPALLAALAACDDSTGPTVVMLVPTVTIEAIGDVVQLEANVTGSTLLPEWESLNPGILTVTRAGMAVAVSEGTAQVIARIGATQAQGTVHVLPEVEIQVTAATKQSEDGGLERIRLDLKNTGGRGFYRVLTYRDPAEPGGEHVGISIPLNDQSVTTGAEFFFQYSVGAPADWVVVYSRSPHSEEYRRTACVRFDGGDCPLAPLAPVPPLP